MLDQYGNLATETASRQSRSPGAYVEQASTSEKQLKRKRRAKLNKNGRIFKESLQRNQRQRGFNFETHEIGSDHSMLTRRQLLEVGSQAVMERLLEKNDRHNLSDYQKT